MPKPRREKVDEVVTPWYHVTSRCVRRASLCGPGLEHRKAWLEDRLRELAGIFAIHCGAYALMDNHLHLVLRLDAPRAEGWSAEEVARRWLTLHPLRDVEGRPLRVAEADVAALAGDPGRVAACRARLNDLGWFMKELKEPLSRMANREDGCTGAFWEGRFGSVAIREEEALLATTAYVDLNPLAAGAVDAPERAGHTSLRARLDHAEAAGAAPGLRDDLSTLTADPRAEAGLWLAPTDDDRRSNGGRPGLAAGFTLACYLRVVDAAARLIRAGKASLPADAPSIFRRLNLSAGRFEATLDALGRRRRLGFLGEPHPRTSPA